MHYTNHIVDSLDPVFCIYGEQIIESLDHFLAALIAPQSVSPTIQENICTLMFLGELYPYLQDKNLWDNIIHETLCCVRETLTDVKLPLTPFGGQVDLAYSASILSENSGHYLQMSSSLNSQLLSHVTPYVGFLQTKYSEMQPNFYDAIFGISGILGYLLTLQGDAFKPTIETAMQYLIGLTGLTRREDLNLELPNWYVKKHNLFTASDQKAYPNGALNLSLSHGIAGPLAAMSIAAIQGYAIPGLHEAIRGLVSDYERFLYVDSQGCPFWDGMLTPEQYSKGVHSAAIEHGSRMSWCYGSTGILRTLFLAAQALKDGKLKNWAHDKMVTISKFSLQKYGLTSPTLCHGYAGLLTILKRQYYDTYDASLLPGIHRIYNCLLSCFDGNSIYGYINIDHKVMEGGAVITERTDTRDFLVGAIGVQLSLISGSTSSCLEHHLLLG